MNNPAFQSDDVGPSPTTGSLELQTPGSKSKSSPVALVDSSVVVADCASCCLPLPFLNRFRSPKWFLVFLSVAATVQGVCINGLVNVVITSIERRFHLQSTQSGIIASSYDIGSLIVMIPVSYLGGRLGTSKPRWIAGGMLAMALGSLVWTLPHFSTDAYMPTLAGEEEDGPVLCGTAGPPGLPGRDGRSAECSGRGEGGEGGSLAAYRFVFVLGQLLHGLGAAPLITLGTTFLDESVSKRSSPLYIAVFQTWFVIGPAIGFVMGGSLLSLHTDLVSSPGLTPASSLWVGAWWPGFLLTFIASILSALVLQCFPASINRKRDTTLVNKEKEGKLKPLPAAIWALVTNPTYIFVSLAGGVDGLIISGLSAFLPKFIEQQYQISNGVAAQLVGLIVVPAGGGGTFFGGWLIKRLNLSRHGIILMCLLSQMITIPTIFVYFMTCSGPDYVGLSLPSASQLKDDLLPEETYFPTPPPSNSFSSSCNAACSCPEAAFDPVCGSDGLMYLSPCLAGCSSSLSSNNFTDCACIQGIVYPGGSADDFYARLGGSAERRICASDCGLLIPFIIVQFCGVFLTFFATMPSVVASLRAVREEERSLALGLQSIILRVVGSIPGPILFGVFMDKACSLWEQTCEERGSCLLYDNYQMAVSMVGISVTAKIISIICFILGYFFSRRSNIIDSTEAKEDDLGRVQCQAAQSNPAFDGEQQDERWRQAYVPFGPEKTVKSN